MAMTKFVTKLLAFWQTCLTSNTNEAEIKEQADLIELPVRLMMHGVPPELVGHATAEQLQVLLEIYKRDQKDGLELKGTATAYGIGLSFGGKK